MRLTNGLSLGKRNRVRGAAGHRRRRVARNRSCGRLASAVENQPSDVLLAVREPFVPAFRDVEEAPKVSHSMAEPRRMNRGERVEESLGAGGFAGVSGRVCPPQSPGRNQVPITTSGGVRS